MTSSEITDDNYGDSCPSCGRARWEHPRDDFPCGQRKASLASKMISLEAIRERLGRKQMDGSNQCAWHQGQRGVECKVCDGLALLAALDGVLAALSELRDRAATKPLMRSEVVEFIDGIFRDVPETRLDDGRAPTRQVRCAKHGIYEILVSDPETGNCPVCQKPMVAVEVKP